MKIGETANSDLFVTVRRVGPRTNRVERSTGPFDPAKATESSRFSPRVRGTALAVVLVCAPLTLGLVGCGRGHRNSAGQSATDSSSVGTDSGSPTTIPGWMGPPTSYDPSRPTTPGSSTPFPSSSNPGQGSSRTTQPGGGPNSSGQLPTTTVAAFVSFNCTVRVSEFRGGKSGDNRYVMVSVRLLNSRVPTVWTSTAWDKVENFTPYYLPPNGQLDVVVAAPGTEWPVATVYATSDRQPRSQMCSSD